MHSKHIGLGIGAGAGALLGAYAIFPMWRNKQVTFTQAQATWMPWAAAVGFGIIGAGIGVMVAKRVSKDAAETRPQKRKREYNSVYYGGHAIGGNPTSGLSGIHTPVMVFLEFPGGKPDVNEHLLVFPTMGGTYNNWDDMKAWSPSDGHTSVSKEYLKTLRRASPEMAKKVVDTYKKGYDDGYDYTIVTRFPKAGRKMNGLSEPNCPPRKRKKSTRPKMTRTSKTIKLGRKTVRVTYLSDGETYAITAKHPAVQAFIASHPRYDEEVVLMAAETVAAEKGLDAVSVNAITQQYGLLRLPFSLYTSVGKEIMQRQLKMTDADADTFAHMAEWAMSEANKM